MSKPCSKCGSTERTVVSRNCVPCKKAYDKAYYRRNRVALQRYHRAYALERSHGLTLDQWNEMLIAQAGRCAICEEAFAPNWWSIHVDHCHSTDRIRGLLCGGCNKALGRFGDDLPGVMRVVAYLQQTERR